MQEKRQKIVDSGYGTIKSCQKKKQKKHITKTKKVKSLQLSRGVLPQCALNLHELKYI
jgi:hypothetical protein